MSQAAIGSIPAGVILEMLDSIRTVVQGAIKTAEVDHGTSHYLTKHAASLLDDLQSTIDAECEVNEEAPLMRAA